MSLDDKIKAILKNSKKISNRTVGAYKILSEYFSKGYDNSGYIRKTINVLEPNMNKSLDNYDNNLPHINLNIFIFLHNKKLFEEWFENRNIYDEKKVIDELQMVIDHSNHANDIIKLLSLYNRQHSIPIQQLDFSKKSDQYKLDVSNHMLDLNMCTFRPIIQDRETILDYIYDNLDKFEHKWTKNKKILYMLTMKSIINNDIDIYETLSQYIDKSLLVDRMYGLYNNHGMSFNIGNTILNDIIDSLDKTLIHLFYATFEDIDFVKLKLILDKLEKHGYNIFNLLNDQRGTIIKMYNRGNMDPLTLFLLYGGKTQKTQYGKPLYIENFIIYKNILINIRELKNNLNDKNRYELLILLKNSDIIDRYNYYKEKAREISNIELDNIINKLSIFDNDQLDKLKQYIDKSIDNNIELGI